MNPTRVIAENVHRTKVHATRRRNPNVTRICPIQASTKVGTTETVTTPSTATARSTSRTSSTTITTTLSQFHLSTLAQVLTAFGISFQECQHKPWDTKQDVSSTQLVSTTSEWAHFTAEKLKEQFQVTTVSQLGQFLQKKQTQQQQLLQQQQLQQQQHCSVPFQNDIFSNPCFLHSLNTFLPGPISEACFQLAQQAVQRVEDSYKYHKGNVSKITNYKHRSKRGHGGNEKWRVSRIQSNEVNGKKINIKNSNKNMQHSTFWNIEQMHVDCSGLVRNVLCSVMDLPELTLLLSDRKFMRAKDFFNFFQSLDDSVTSTCICIGNKTSNPNCSASLSTRNQTIHTSSSTNNSLHSQDKGSTTPFPVQVWRRVDDLRMLLPGDIIAYRREGKAAGGAAFTYEDTKDLFTLLKAVRRAQLYAEFNDNNIDGDNNHDNNDNDHDAKLRQNGKDDSHNCNIAKDEAIVQWAKELVYKLSLPDTFGILHLDDLKMLAATRSTFWSDLKEFLDFQSYHDSENTVDRMYEALYAPETNTGHIMFAAGLPECVRVSSDREEYRVPIFHSTEFGRTHKDGSVKKRHKGVERSFKRFTRILATKRWIRERTAADGDEVSGKGGVVNVLAARMCF